MNENNIFDLMNNINYGWFDKKGTININNFNSFSDDYILQSPRQIIENQVGVCWDQVELERYYFGKTKYKYKTYFLVHFDDDKCPTHTFLVFLKNNNYYWFEHSWEKFKGIHKYNSLNELLKDVIDKFVLVELNNNYQKDKLHIYEYEKPTYGIGVEEYFKHCTNGKFIDVEYL